MSAWRVHIALPAGLPAAAASPGRTILLAPMPNWPHHLQADDQSSALLYGNRHRDRNMVAIRESPTWHCRAWAEAPRSVHSSTSSEGRPTRRTYTPTPTRG